jgi:hypothetical protein
MGEVNSIKKNPVLAGFFRCAPGTGADLEVRVLYGP